MEIADNVADRLSAHSNGYWKIRSTALMNTGCGRLFHTDVAVESALAGCMLLDAFVDTAVALLLGVDCEVR